MIDGAPLPPDLREFLAKGGTRYRGDDGDWEIKIEAAPPPFLVKALPPRSLIIANNGCGDHLFLTAPEAEPRAFGPAVFVFWHDGQEIAPYLDDLRKLTHPPAPKPTDRKPVLYSDGVTPVQPGDRVTQRGCLQFWRRFPGTVNYVPGISKKNREMEHDGLAWIGIKTAGGVQSGVWVEPKTSCVGKSVAFLGRAAAPVKELGPEEDLD